MATAPNMASAASPKMAELRRRLTFLVMALVVFRIGSHIPVPGINLDQLQHMFKDQSGGILNLFNMFSGGARKRFSVFAPWIMPYIPAPIGIQLTSDVLRTSERLKKEGEAGQRKIHQ